jgi:hypothetical protein
VILILNEAKKGPKLNPKLAEIGKSLLITPLTRERVEEVSEKYPNPENLENAVPRVNDCVWVNMTPVQQKTDLKVSTLQGYTVKAVNAVLTAADGLKAGKGDPKVFLPHLLDAVSLLGRSSMEMSLLWRQLMKPSLGDYQELCKESQIYSIGDIESKMKEVKSLKEKNKEFTKSKPKFGRSLQRPIVNQHVKNEYGRRYQERYRPQHQQQGQRYHRNNPGPQKTA